MSKSTVSTLILAAALSTTAVSAAPIRIDFDDLQSNTIVGNNYAHLGVSFDNAVARSFGPLPGTSGTNALTTQFSGTRPQPSNPLSAVFSSAVSSVGLTGVDVGLAGFVLTAYDAQVGGNIVDTQKVFGTNLGFNEFFKLTVSGANIRRVEFSQAISVPADGTVFDDFVFERAEVPEPASLGLLGLGIGALALGRRKRKIAH